MIDNLIQSIEEEQNNINNDFQECKKLDNIIKKITLTSENIVAINKMLDDLELNLNKIEQKNIEQNKKISLLNIKNKKE